MKGCFLFVLLMLIGNGFSFSRYKSYNKRPTKSSSPLSLFMKRVGWGFKSLDKKICDAEDDIDYLNREKNIQKTRLNNLEEDQVVQEGRLNNLEAKQMTLMTTSNEHTTAISVLEASDNTQDGRLTDLEASDNTQDGRLTDLEASDNTQDGRLTDLEASDNAQDGKLTDLEGIQDDLEDCLLDTKCELDNRLDILTLNLAHGNPECFDHKLLDANSRRSTRRVGGSCDGIGGGFFGQQSPDWHGEDWYRFDDFSMMPEIFVDWPACGSYWPTRLFGVHPTSVGKVSATFVDDTYRQTTGFVTNCGTYFVYFLPELKYGSQCGATYCSAPSSCESDLEKKSNSPMVLYFQGLELNTQQAKEEAIMEYLKIN